MRRAICLLTTVCLCGALLSAASAAKLVDRIVAVVNGEIITLHDLQSEIRKQAPGMDQGGESGNPQSPAMQRRVLQAMINDKLLKQEAERFGIKVSDVEIDAQIDQIMKDRDMTRAELKKTLQNQGMDFKEYRQALRQEIKKNRVLSSMVRQKVVVGDAEMKAYYEQHKQEYNQPKTVHLRLIVNPSKTRLEQVREAIHSGQTTFAQAAGKVSQGPGAEQGGDLGELSWKDLKPQWRKILEPLHSGQVSRVFPLQGNYALLYLEAVAEQKVKPFDAVQDGIRQKLYGQKLDQRYQQYIQSLRDKAVIDVRLQHNK